MCKADLRPVGLSKYTCHHHTGHTFLHTPHHLHSNEFHSAHHILCTRHQCTLHNFQGNYIDIRTGSLHNPSSPVARNPNRCSIRHPHSIDRYYNSRGHNIHRRNRFLRHHSNYHTTALQQVLLQQLPPQQVWPPLQSHSQPVGVQV